jgi:hypothetical protein
MDPASRRPTGILLIRGYFMSKVESIEQQIRELSLAELSQLRDWFAQFDAEAWDRQFEADAKAGKLEALADRTLREHSAGRSTKL